MGVSIQVDDQKLLEKLNTLAGMDISPAISKCCALVEREAKQKAPVKSGELRRSIQSKVMGNEGEVGTDLFYAPYVEYGTGIFSSLGNGRKDVPWFYQDVKGKWHSTCGSHPHPYLIPAFEENRGKINKIIQDYIEKELGK